MRQKLDVWQTVFMAMLFTSVIPSSPAIDPAHARAGAAFRMCVSVIGLIGLIVVLQRKNKLPKEPAADRDTMLIPGEPVIQVTYNSTPVDTWRCTHYILFRDWHWWCFYLGFGALSAFGMSSSVNRDNPILAVDLFPLFVVVGVAAWIAFTYFLCWVTYKGRFPTPDTQRVCTSTLTARGFHDASPDKTSHIAWKQVRAIRMHNGDTYVFAKWGDAHFVSRTAFPDEAAARRFYAAVVTLWKSNGTVWPGDNA